MRRPQIRDSDRKPGYVDRLTAGDADWLLLAVFAAPLGGCVAAALLSAYSPAILSCSTEASSMLRAAWMFGSALPLMFLVSMIFYPAGLAAVIVFGLPLHGLLAALQRTKWLSYAVAGALAGTPCWYALVSMNPAPCGDTSNPRLQDLSWLAVIGQVAALGLAPSVGVALTFWAVLRPDRFVAAAPPSSAPAQR